MDAIRRTNVVARQLELNPRMPWDKYIEQVRCLQIKHPGQSCLSLREFLQVLKNHSVESLKYFFSSLNVLMVTMAGIHGSFREDMDRRANFITETFSGLIVPRYTNDRWYLLKEVHQFQTSLCPVRLRCVLSSRNMMMTSTAQVGFFFQCVMRGSNPRLKLATMSPGIFCIFLRKLCANAAKSGQSTYLIRIIAIFARFYGLNPMILRKMLKI